MSPATQPLHAKLDQAQSLSPGKRKNSLRTTVTLSPEAIEIVNRLKAATGFSTSGAIEELIFRSGPQRSWLVEENGILVIHAPVKDGKLTDESVRKMLEESPF